ncbi:hypothetical protein [Desulforhopalus singaporensis]|uniref:Uncharacterized protein n=1 Tax=Desulforhopalus singaporensis TaxID=91360 RepID=A0A1H0M7A0_9BACT|nr:hypothetical protein [Desulforhopalus singaporensis]SDO75980.1 hypothetical protein SAMN05660330_01000 [Desulforhopalus singaporensis]
MPALPLKAIWLSTVALVCFLFVAPVHGKEVPLSIAGISIGSDINSYPNIMDTNFMKEKVITDWHGFRKGVISYGVCLYSDRILKIDMKYADKSKTFYNKLLDKFKEKFGEPDIWEGDSFGVKYIWKWNFYDANNDKVTLKLQHNSKDTSESIGNMVKLAYPEKIIEERKCFMKMCRNTMNNFPAQSRDESQKTGWSYLIPD